MSIQPSQVTSIDFTKKPEGATHYGARVNCETTWYKLEGSAWSWWGAQAGEWVKIRRVGGQPARTPVPIPAQPDWSKGPVDATHWGPATGPGGGPSLGWAEAFHRFDGKHSYLATDLTGWGWIVRPEPVPAARLAMLIERPKAFDWSVAPEDATHRTNFKSSDPFRKVVGDDAFMWFRGEWSRIGGAERDDYIPRPADAFVPFDFSGKVLDFGPAAKLAEMGWSKAPNWATLFLVHAQHPTMYAWASAMEKGAKFERLDGTDCTGHLLPEFWQVVGGRVADGSGKGLPLIVKPWEGELPPPGHPIDYLGHDGEWSDGTYVGLYLGQVVVACRRSGAVGFLDYKTDTIKWESPQWDGEGLPPIEMVCERSFSHSTWKVTTICGHSTDGAYASFYDGDGLMGWGDKCSFRPPRTPEQIAADERLHKIRNAATDIARTLEACSKTVAYKDIAATVLEAMIDAGYARPVKA